MPMKMWVNGEKVLASDLNANFANLGGRIKFGGSGADGALAISSGTTTVDLGGAQVYELNYSSISITGTGKLAFSNPHANGTIVVIKCSGDCTLTSSQAPMIDCSGLGANGGTGGTRSTTGGNTHGDAGQDGTSFVGIATDGGHGTAVGAGTEPGSAYTYLFKTTTDSNHNLFNRYPKIYVGGGGAGAQAVYSSGGSGSVIGGNGGRGGGCLIMEINGEFNFTTANGISVAGAVGTNGSITGSPGTYSHGGGGGGAGGIAIILYNEAGTITGTINSSGGAGGTGGFTGGANSVSGGGGGALGAGNAGSNSSGPTGGSGANGSSLMTLNRELA